MRYSVIKFSFVLVLLLDIGVISTRASEEAEPGGLDMSTLIGQPKGDPISGPELDRQEDALTSVMRCPVCQGLSVADSSTLSAIAIKNQVRAFLADGYSQTQVLDYFEQSYGEFIRLEPKARGFNLVVWIAPILVFLIGCALVVRWVRSSSTLIGVQAGATDADLEAYLERVRRETA